MAGWNSKDPVKAMRGLEDVLDRGHSPDRLDKVARRAFLPEIRAIAAEYKAELEGYAERAEKNDPKCEKCGAPLVKVPYYTAVKHTPLMGPTTFTDLKACVSSFCPRCACRKEWVRGAPAAFLLCASLLALLASIVLLILALLHAVDGLAAPIGVVGLIVSVGLAGFAGNHLGVSNSWRAAWASRKKTPITTEEIEARYAGTAFYGKMKPYNVPYDLSSLYVRTRTLDRIPHEKKADVALSEAYVEQMRKNAANKP